MEDKGGRRGVMASLINRINGISRIYQSVHLYGLSAMKLVGIVPYSRRGWRSEDQMQHFGRRAPSYWAYDILHRSRCREATKSPDRMAAMGNS